MKVFFLASVSAVMLLFYGCSSQPSHDPAATLATDFMTNATDNPEQWVARALAAPSEQQRAEFYLKAAQQYWDSNLIAQTNAALQSIKPAALTPQSLQNYLILSLRLGLAEDNVNRLEKTLPLLASKPLAQTNMASQIELVQLQARAHQSAGNHLHAAIILAENIGLFEPERQQEMSEAIWSELRKVSAAELNPASYRGDNYDVKGWLTLALQLKQPQMNLEDQLSVLQHWEAAWPSHQALIHRPYELQILTQLPTSRPTIITLALPLSGPLAEAGTAIRDGFMASYYDSGSAQNNKLKIIFFDTQLHDIEALYNNNHAQNSLIIGPLDKKSLNRLAEFDQLNTKTLALNYLEALLQQPKNLFQFGLAPEEEAYQVATHITDKQFTKIAVIAPENAWGFRIHDTFKQALNTTNGMLIESVFYGDQTTLSETVARLLATDESKKRAQLLQSITGGHFEFLPRRRQDIDAIFLVAKPEIAKQLNPLFAFHYAKEIPVFATSQINSQRQNEREPDLDGIEFVEIPWMLSTANTIKNTLNRQLPESSGDYSRFYALGADTFMLAPRLQLLKEIAGSQVEGQTGRLSMDSNGKITRQMQWARFKNGKAIAIQE